MLSLFDSRGLELLDAPRCFNCGSYSHSLKECSKPRNNAAVNNSRKQLKSKRNQTAGMRNPARYYQDSPGGKYQGLKPGVLNEETRRLLGLGVRNILVNCCVLLFKDLYFLSGLVECVNASLLMLSPFYALIADYIN